jgi:hypothetical protein
MVATAASGGTGFRSHADALPGPDLPDALRIDREVDPDAGQVGHGVEQRLVIDRLPQRRVRATTVPAIEATTA